MGNWTDLGGGWTYSEQHDALWLRHQCTPDHMSTGDAKESHTVLSREPLSLAPSVVCECGAHGYIRGGKWESV